MEECVEPVPGSVFIDIIGNQCTQNIIDLGCDYDLALLGYYYYGTDLEDWTMADECPCSCGTPTIFFVDAGLKKWTGLKIDKICNF